MNEQTDFEKVQHLAPAPVQDTGTGEGDDVKISPAEENRGAQAVRP